MNNSEEKVAPEGRAADDRFAKEPAKVANRSAGFSLLNRDRVQVRSAELLLQGALIASFFGGQW
jgi:hypothetical protein